MTANIPRTVIMVLMLLGASFCDRQVEEIKNTVTDVDGNVYRTVRIGRQEWMAENLRVTRYRNGTPIPQYSDYREWSGAYTGLCTDYEFIGDNLNGKLYNWPAVEEYAGHYLAPEGWHIPALEEWNELIETLGGISEAGEKLKDKLHWQGDENSLAEPCGFNALPSGYRDAHGYFRGRGSFAYFWSVSNSPEYDFFKASVTIFGPRPSVQVFIGYPSEGYSVRCVKNR